MNVLGFDIGGANIKASTADGETMSVEFPMWQRCDDLSDTVSQLGSEFSVKPDLIGLTMTGELADCFASKAEGVEYIVRATEQAFPGVPMRVWLTSGEFCEPDDAVELPTLAAAANWHALATWAGRAIPSGPGILIDIGSTTTDVIPLLDGRPMPRGLTDVERLMSGELIYTGATRTPVCAVTREVTFHGQACPLAAELFATTADVHLLVGSLFEDPGDTNTADSRPLSRQHSLNRLAHMLCCDTNEIDENELVQIAHQIEQKQLGQIQSAVLSVLDYLRQESGQSQTLPQIVISGSGTFLAQQVVDSMSDHFGDRIVVAEMFRHPVASSACAFAIARLAHDRCRDELLETSTL